MEIVDKLKLLISKKYISVVLFVLLDIVFILFLAYLGYKIYGVYTETQALNAEIDQLKSSSLLIKNNKDLLEENISEYNALLDRLIPDGETYFQVISSLEQLEDRMGVSINSYSINLSETTEEKMSLTLTISGTKQSIETLFEKYHFSSGRLMTNEKLDYSREGLESTTFTVNIFHATADTTLSNDVAGSNVISTEDIEFIKSIEAEL